MANKNFTIAICATGETDDAQSDLDAFIAGLKLRGMWIGSATLTPDEVGPVAVNAPELSVGENNLTVISIPDFERVEGVMYILQWSDDGWNTFNPISDNVGPNDTFEHEHIEYRKYRVAAYLNGVPTYGVSSFPSP